MPGRSRTAPPSAAELADRHELYQQAVQSPEGDISYFLQWFELYRGRVPTRLREDFCGTALLSCTWVAGADDRSAVGVDLDAEVLAWGAERNLTALSEEQYGRVRLLQADVRDAPAGESDITCAMNFSFCVFKQRSDLLDYFGHVHRNLARDGLFVAEMYGGTEAIIAAEERREVGDVTYVWDQVDYNPVTGETHCSIHFEFADGSEMRDAFTYDWRLWSLPELSDALTQAGFSEVRVWWEEVDEEGEGTGVYRETDEEENQETYLVYVVALA